MNRLEVYLAWVEWKMAIVFRGFMKERYLEKKELRVSEAKGK